MGLELDIEEIRGRFGNGICCSMSVFGALAPLLGVDEDTAMKIAAGFCGGVEQNNFCGCISGAKMALGLKYSGGSQGGTEKVQLLLKKIREFEEQFEEEFGSRRCPEILGGLDPSLPADKPKIAELQLHQRVCSDAICYTVELVSEMLEEEE